MTYYYYKNMKKCCKFQDIVPARRSKKGSCNGKSRMTDEVITSHLHCPIADGATVIAALRGKVNQINALHIDKQREANVQIHSSEAVDTGPMGLNVTNEQSMAATDKKARSQLRSLSMYVIAGRAKALDTCLTSVFASAAHTMTRWLQNLMWLAQCRLVSFGCNCIILCDAKSVNGGMSL